MLNELEERKVKEIFKEALAEVLEAKRDWFIEVFSEVVEDIALAHAIAEGENTPKVSRQEISDLLSA